jgi:2-dehydro-3-deoxyphosphooctonate aldolase (KDO 8-P synthase)
MSQPSGAPVPSTKAVRVGKVTFGGGAPFALIAGPCVIESRDHALRHAERIRRIAAESKVPVIYKSSYDKANRSSGKAFRGPGVDQGLRILEEVRSTFDVPVLTDVHSPEQATAAGQVVDCLQIPAFLCRQTDLLIAAARTGKAVSVKKGQFLAPEDTKNLVDKVRAEGNDQVMLTERGASFGYHTLVVDFTGFPVMRGFAPLVFDATHAVQRPGGLGTATGGDRSKVPYLARAAIACGVDGLFMEVHEDPDKAPSDGPNMVRMTDLAGILAELVKIQAALR